MEGDGRSAALNRGRTGGGVRGRTRRPSAAAAARRLVQTGAPMLLTGRRASPQTGSRGASQGWP